MLHFFVNVASSIATHSWQVPSELSRKLKLVVIAAPWADFFMQLLLLHLNI